MGAQETPHQDEISELENKIIQQVEYYFGNYNLRRDKFLKEQMKLDDGWVPLEVMIRFNRLKSLCEDPSVIAGALKKSSSHLLEVSEDDTKIRRCLDKPVPEFSSETKVELDSRTIYAKRFPGATTLDELLQFFKGFGNIESIFMKKKPNKTFKGSVFVTFGTQEEAQNFLKLGSVKFNNNDLMRESKEAYVKRKEMEFQQRKSAKEKKQKKHEQEHKKESEDQSESLEKDFDKGCVLKLSGLSETTTREHINELFQSDGKIAYLEYSRGKPEAFVRFAEGIAESVLEKYSKEEDDIKKITVNGADAIAMVLKGEIESEYWQKILKAKFDVRQRGGNFKKGKGRFNPKTAGKDRSRFGKRGRRNNAREEETEKSDETTEPPNKVIKLDKDDSGPAVKTEKDNSD